MKLKSLLFSFIGDYPRTHRLTQLFTEVMRLVNNKCGISDFYNGNREMILLLEFAYIASRYMPPRFTKENVDKALVITERFNEVVRRLLS